ncbi:hypothetical protein ABZ471_44415 [Streptomyces sp. NPDC005728]|uniref:Lsr2 family DNA-binding protein n=1 Tax=Streptomyces sp. NPDC005728 TaxID=3157054 RepID=UPI0033C6A4E8
MLKSRHQCGDIQHVTGLSTGQLAALAEVQGLSQTATRSGGLLSGIDPALLRGMAALTKAEQTADRRVRRQSVRVRELLGVLVDHQSRIADENRIRAEIADINKKLSALQSKLSRLDTSSTMIIRAWAKDRGLPVSRGGVLSAKAIDAFEEHTRLTAQVGQARAITAARLQCEIANLRRSRTAACRRLEHMTSMSTAEVQSSAEGQDSDVPVGNVLPAHSVTDDLCVLSPPNVKEPQTRDQATWRHHAGNLSSARLEDGRKPGPPPVMVATEAPGAMPASSQRAHHEQTPTGKAAGRSVERCGQEAAGPRPGQRGWVRVQVAESFDPPRDFCSGHCASVAIAHAEKRMPAVP